MGTSTLKTVVITKDGQLLATAKVIREVAPKEEYEADVLLEATPGKVIFPFDETTIDIYEVLGYMSSRYTFTLVGEDDEPKKLRITAIDHEENLITAQFVL